MTFDDISKLNIHKLLKDIQHDIYITIPNDLWNKLYQNLQKEVINWGSSRYTSLLVDKTFDHIQIINLQHDVFVDIPQILDDISQVNFTKNFDHISQNRQNKIKQIIQHTINQANTQWSLQSLPQAKPDVNPNSKGD